MRVFTSPTTTTGGSQFVADNGPNSGHGHIVGNGSGCDFTDLPLNLYENFLRGKWRNPQEPCLGFRGDLDPQKYTWFSYQQVDLKVCCFAAGLEQFELVPVVTEKEGCISHKLLGIFMKNRVEWVVAQLAAFRNGTVVVPLYQTLGADAIQYIVNQTKLTTIVCSDQELDRVLEIRNCCPSLKNIVLCDGAIDVTCYADRLDDINVFLFGDILKRGGENPRGATPMKLEDTCTIMYTSGTTGNPKGVMMSQKSILYSSKSNFQKFTGFKNCVHLSYLPLPHAFEMCAQVMVFHSGGRIGFSQGDASKILDDLTLLEPTIFPTVPRLLNKIYDKIQLQLKSKSWKSMIFAYAYKMKLKNAVKYGIDSHWFYDMMIFNQLRKKLGFGRCKQIIVGGAPTSVDVLRFFRLSFLCNVSDGYGATETTSCITATEFTDFPNGHVGGPNVVNHVKLISVPEMGYYVSDTSHTSGQGQSIPCIGRGEICAKGPNIFKGYFKMPNETAKVLDKDGWYQTGDIGLWTPDRQLKIIDRKKNIFKLSQGEYVAPEKIENVLRLNPYIEQVFVYGDSYQSHLVGLVVVDCANLSSLVEKHGLTLAKDFCTNREIVMLVLEELKKTSIQYQLAGFEIVKNICLLEAPFDEKLLTPTFKLRRHLAKKEYLPLIEQMYSNTI